MKDMAKLVSILERALESKHGLKLKAHDPDGLRRRLYVVMRRCREADPPDSRFTRGLRLRLGPRKSNLLLVLPKEGSDARS
jgi:hypothetical protein